MKTLSLFVLPIVGIVSSAHGDVKPAGTVLTDQCGKATALGVADEVCITRPVLTRGPAPEQVRYVTLSKKEQISYLRLAPEKLRIRRPQGCTGYVLEGVYPDDKGNALLTEGTAVFCDNAHVADKKARLTVTLFQGKSSFEEAVDTELVSHPK